MASKSLVQIQFEEFSSIKNVQDLICKSVPMTKKVLNMLQGNTKTSVGKDVFDFVRKFLRGLEATMLRNYLKFATGADVICTEAIYIHFSQPDDLARRPTAHTAPVFWKCQHHIQDIQNSVTSGQNSRRMTSGEMIMPDLS